MKNLIILSVGITVLCLSSCTKDNDINKNTWELTPNGAFKEVYKTKTAVLRTNIKYVLEVKSEDNPGGGYSGISSTITLAFSTIEPPPSGTYKVTSYNKLTSTDQVSINVLTYGSSQNGGTHTGWNSPEGGNQTISYKFENGKASAVFKDIVINQNGSTGPTAAKVSANISQ